jgi:hypothetical protein
LIWQYHVGWWPISDLQTIEQYGSTSVAVTFRFGNFILLGLHTMPGGRDRGCIGQTVFF